MFARAKTYSRVPTTLQHPDEETGSDERKASSFESTSTETPIKKNDKLDEMPNRPDGTKGGAELESKTALDTRQVQDEHQILPWNVAIAKIAFHSHSGITYFAKASSRGRS